MSTIKPDGEYWQPELETMPREQLQQLQVKKLKKSIEIALQSPFYKKRLGDRSTICVRFRLQQSRTFVTTIRLVS